MMHSFVTEDLITLFQSVYLMPKHAIQFGRATFRSKPSTALMLQNLLSAPKDSHRLTLSTQHAKHRSAHLSNQFMKLKIPPKQTQQQQPSTTCGQ
jgi:hypothetical protein